MERTYKILVIFVMFIGCIETSWSLSFHLLKYSPGGTGEPRNCGYVEILPTEQNAYETLQNAAKKNCQVPNVMKFIYASRCKNGYGMMSYKDISLSDQDRNSIITRLKPDSKGNINLYIVQ